MIDLCSVDGSAPISCSAQVLQIKSRALFSIGVLSSLLSLDLLAAPKSCGVVTIEKLLAGPKHGAMMRVDNPACVGHEGWICLDPDAQHMSQAESDRMFSFLLAYHLSGKQIQITIEPEVSTSSCGTYAIIEDVRTP